MLCRIKNTNGMHSAHHVSWNYAFLTKISNLSVSLSVRKIKDDSPPCREGKYNLYINNRSVHFQLWEFICSISLFDIFNFHLTIWEKDPRFLFLHKCQMHLPPSQVRTSKRHVPKPWERTHIGYETMSIFSYGAFFKCDMNDFIASWNVTLQTLLKYERQRRVPEPWERTHIGFETRSSSSYCSFCECDTLSASSLCMVKLYYFFYLHLTYFMFDISKEYKIQPHHLSCIYLSIWNDFFL